eukprot:gene5574-6135_t
MFEKFEEYGISILNGISDLFYESFRFLWKSILHLFTRQCEIERICRHGQQMHSADMTIHFATSLSFSKQLREVTDIVFSGHIFPIQDCSRLILERKHLSRENSLLTANLKNCLRHLNLINAAIERIMELKSVVFSDSVAEHVDLLESLWRNLLPGVTRVGGRITEDWGKLGFQGKDPATDFRGMGLLGLIQLVYFSQSSPQLARQLLQESQADATYFPFAATGINVTAFVLELLQERRFHVLMIRELDKILLEDSGMPSDGKPFDAKTVEQVVEIIHKMYTILFLRLGRAWLTSDSVDLMAFPKVYSAFKVEARTLYPKL